MSVVVWDGKTLAADRQLTYGDTIYTTKKLWKMSELREIPGCKVIIAFVGSTWLGLQLKEWYENGANVDEYPKAEKDDNAKLIVVEAEATAARCFYYEGKTPVRTPVLDNFSAWGVGREAALGALAMGADAVKAVEIASKYVVGCGRGCDYATIQQFDYRFDVGGQNGRRKDEGKATKAS